MAKGPFAAAKQVVASFDLLAAPEPARVWLVRISLSLGWFMDTAAAEDAAEQWEAAFLEYLRRELSAMNALGRISRYAFNSSSEYMIQGASFEEGTESDELKDAKRRRASLADYERFLADLTPTQFEATCRGMLAELGVNDPRLTARTADQGIDFYGRLRLEGKLSQFTGLPSVHQHLNVWMIGQAKHYKRVQVATPDIRELVGAIDLARAKAYAGSRVVYEDLDIRVCDPIFYLFFTTGTISSDGWDLLIRSGVIAMDGRMVAAFLADSSIGWKDERFDLEAALSWLQSHG